MFKKPLNFGVCPSHFFGRKTNASKVFHTAGEHAETSTEKDDLHEFKAETAFDPKKEWNQQILSLVKTAMPDEKYESYIDMGFLDYITTGIDFQKFQAERQNVAKLKLEHGVIICVNEDGGKVAQFDISPAIQKILDKWKDHDCELCYRSSRRERRLLTANTGRSESRLRILAAIKAKQEGKGKDAQTKILEAPKPPVDPLEEAAKKRRQEVMQKGREKRENILRSVEQEPDYNFSADVSPTIQNDDAKTFEKHWPAMDYSKDIDDLFQHDANQEEGYQVNPFFRQGWNREKLRDLIQEGDNAKLDFNEVADAIYTDRFEKFKKELKEKGMPDEVLDMLGEDLLDSYRKLSEIYDRIKNITKAEEIPDKYRKIFRFRPQIKEAVQILGDYIAYANKLVNLVEDLRYNPGDEILTRSARDATMKEYDSALKQPSDRVKRALHSLFLDGVDSPREYTSEIKYLFSSDKSARAITFQDLNGRTATLQTDEWLDQSPETAYKLALEQIGDPEKNEDGKWVERVAEDDAKNHLNNLLQLGISAYTVGPKKRGIKEVMDDLTKAGVELSPGVRFRYSGDSIKDTQNLFAVLSLKNLNDLYAKDSEKARMIARERTTFIRLGSVVYQKNRFNEAERKQQERERQSAEKAAGIKLSPSDAESICAELRKTNRFSEEQLAKLKGALIGGAVVVLPSHGGAFSIHYEFDNGVTIDLTGAFPEWESFAAGAAVGKKFNVSEDIIVSINVAAGYSFANNASGGPMVGGGVSFTKKFKQVDVSVVGGGGVLLGPMIPVGFTGLGLNWAKTQDRYEETLTKKEVETGIAELDKLGNTDAIYAEVSQNPSKYPAITRIYDQIDNIPNLNEASKRDMFKSAYSMFKTGIQGEAIDESKKNWYEKFIPTGAGLGIVWVGPVPVPYAYLEFNLWSRNLVYRIATSVQRAEQISEAQASEKILADYNKANAKKVETKTLATTGELTIDPKTGKLVLKSIKGGEIDFSHLDKLGQFTDALSRDAKIFVEQDKNELLRLRPKEAYGNVEIYVDPELKDDVIVVTKPGDAHLYLSVKKDKQIFFKREDVTFPFEERGAVERTVVTISANPYLDTETIQKQSTWHIDRTPTTTWIKRPHAGYGVAETQKPQDNIKTNDEYNNWWKKEERTDRLEFVDANEYKEAYKNLTSTITIARERENADVKIRPEIRSKIEKLTKDGKFLNHFRALTTERFDLKNPRHKSPVGNWDIDFPELVRDLKTKLNVPDLNEYETNAAVIALLIASFQNIHKGGAEKAKEEYLKFLESFERPMLTAIFEQYYKNDPDKDKKTDDAVKYIIGQLENIDINSAGEKVTQSTLFGTLVGMSGITGIRRLYNYNETNPEWGVVGRKTLDVTKKDVSGEVADFWVNKLSPYVPRLQEKNDLFRYKDEIFENMNSPLALKLAPLVAVIFNPEEMGDLKNYYEKNKREAQITEDNKGTIKKFLGWCDKVRQAELNGEKEVKLDENFKILLDLKVSMGIYKECGNITGLVNETFALVSERAEKIYYYAGLGEGIIDVEHKYERVDFYVMAGIALPLPREQRVTRPERHPHRRPTPKIPPGEIPPEEIPPTPQPEVPTAEEIPHPVEQPAGTTGGAAGEGTIVAETEGGSASE